MENQEQEQNKDKFDVGFFKDEKSGKYITLKLSMEEFQSFSVIKASLSQLGWKIPMTTIVRRVMDIGASNLDLEAIKQNPIKLFNVEGLVA